MNQKEEKHPKGRMHCQMHFLPLTFSADCAVPKKMGMKANQMMQVVYMVNPIGLASLKVSGTPLVLMA
jgi:hypothetical protein